MHPNPLFRTEDRALMEALIDEIGFGMVFLATPDGPRVAHTPLLSTGDGAVKFHLARSNALTRHLAGATALVTVNGPDGYVSPRWYANRDTVPTWDYVALELEGRVRRMADAELEVFLHAVISKHETRIGGDAWRAEEASAKLWAGLFRGIVGFELEILAWRPTIKLSQKKAPEERATIAAGLEAAGSPALAQLMRTLAGTGAA
jgi:transcriptional regulator